MTNDRTILPAWIVERMTAKCASLPCEGDNPALGCAATKASICDWCISCVARADEPSKQPVAYYLVVLEGQENRNEVIVR